MEFLPTWLPFLLFPLGLGVLAITLNQQKQTKLLKDQQARERREKKAQEATYDAVHTSCPKCAEDVKLEASVCRHCGADISESNLIEKRRRNSEFMKWAELEEARAKKLMKEGKVITSSIAIFWAVVAVAGFLVGGLDPFSLPLVMALGFLISAMVGSASMGKARRIRAAIRDIEHWET